MENQTRLDGRLREVLGDALINLKEDRGELAIEVAAQNYLNVARKLRDELQFAQLVDLCGVDYSQLHRHQGKRFAVVSHLLSFHYNWRLRLRIDCPDDADPCVDSLCTVWPNADWYEREAFDLFGITFVGHQDLRRILTDYGFIGHPFRKDFPISGHMEMRYDPELKRIIYQPVTIAPREVTPRVVREESYGNDK